MLTKAHTQARLLRDELEKLSQEHSWWSILQDFKETVDGMESLKWMSEMTPEEREETDKLSEEIWKQVGELQDKLMRFEGLFGAKVGWREITRLHAQIRRTGGKPCPKPKS